MSNFVGFVFVQFNCLLKFLLRFMSIENVGDVYTFTSPCRRNPLKLKSVINQFCVVILVIIWAIDQNALFLLLKRKVLPRQFCVLDLCNKVPLLPAFFHLKERLPLTTLYYRYIYFTKQNHAFLRSLDS